jgi:cytochrome P450
MDQVKELVLLDNFLKESQRCNPPNYLGFNRIATSSFDLSDGTHISKGQFISMPAGPMAMDPEFYLDPESFDPHRFAATSHSEANGKERRDREFVGTEPGNVHWGSGRFTCPGRWYASGVMKVILAKILLKYDIKFPDGQTERLPNVYLDIVIEPNPKQQILFRQRDETGM